MDKGVQKSSITGIGRDNKTINNVISKVKTEVGIDLPELDRDINSKAVVNYF